jgi:hypothetical protein
VPLLPIDLQTLFGQAPQVGREQTLQRDGVPLAQSLQGTQIARRAGVKDATVNEARQQEQGPEQARIREQRRGRRGTPSRDGDRKDRRPKNRPPPDVQDVARDPALGRHVDVSG